MKKYIFIALVLFVSAFTLSGCTKSKPLPAETTNQESQKSLSQPTQSVTPIQNQDPETQKINNKAIKLITDNLSGNMFDLTENDLKVKDNTKGNGVFVYVQQTRFHGVERYILWIVVDNQAYPLNGATKNITPDLPWLREAGNEVVDKIGINKSSATEAIDIVFKN